MGLRPVQVSESQAAPGRAICLRSLLNRSGTVVVLPCCVLDTPTELVSVWKGVRLAEASGLAGHLRALQSAILHCVWQDQPPQVPVGRYGYVGSTALPCRHGSQFTTRGPDLMQLLQSSRQQVCWELTGVPLKMHFHMTTAGELGCVTVQRIAVRSPSDNHFAPHQGLGSCLDYMRMQPRDPTPLNSCCLNAGLLGFAIVQHMGVKF